MKVTFWGLAVRHTTGIIYVHSENGASPRPLEMKMFPDILAALEGARKLWPGARPVECTLEVGTPIWVD